MLVDMMLWGLQYDEQAPVSKAFIRRITQDRQQVVRKLTRAIETGTFESYRTTVMGVDKSLYKLRYPRISAPGV
jgi:hypothetical protein